MWHAYACLNFNMQFNPSIPYHDDVIKWKHFSRYWPFVRGIHQSPLNSPHKGPRRRALIFSLICAWLNAWVDNCEASDLRRHRAHYDVIVMNTIFETNTKQNRFQRPLYNQVQKILVRKITVGDIGSGNGLSSIRCRRISWTSDGIFSIKNWTLGIYFSEVRVRIQNISVIF